MYGKIYYHSEMIYKSGFMVSELQTYDATEQLHVYSDLKAVCFKCLYWTTYILSQCH